ncbi:MAG: hypothetical protein RJB66_1192 [Pseudomonadota bacterium]|jgi:LmbE family N-acetylglucosaminyl deacetylase
MKICVTAILLFISEFLLADKLLAEPIKIPPLSSKTFGVKYENLEIKSKERLLVLAPHPDDETLGAAGLIQRVLKKNGTVRTVVLTAGDGFPESATIESGKAKPEAGDYLKLGAERLKEAQAAAQLIGHGKVQVDFFGFPDAGLYSTLVPHWEPTNPFRSPMTEKNHVPYDAALLFKAPQSGKIVFDQLVKILNEMNPTIITFPDIMETHADHSSTGIYAQLAINEWLNNNSKTQSKLKTKESRPLLLAYLIHWGPDWPAEGFASNPIDLKGQAFYLPKDLPLRAQGRTCLKLEMNETGLKDLAIDQYKTQCRAMGTFLKAFIRKTECFSIIEPNSNLSLKEEIQKWRTNQTPFNDKDAFSRQHL